MSDMSLEERFENARQAASETHSSWEARCHAILNALGFNFGAAPLGVQWLPIELADKSADRIYDLPGMPGPIANSEEYWCRDADGRVFQATWADDGKRAYWWDLDGESPVDPVEFMPHPLDHRFTPSKAKQPEAAQ